MNTLRSLCFALVALAATTSMASHVRGGELWYEYAGVVPGGLLYEINIAILVEPSAPPENPNLLLIVDGAVDTLSPSAILPLGFYCYLQRWMYATTRIFPGPGSHVIQVQYPNRGSGITNVQGNSEVPIGLTTNLTIDLGGPNSSPRFNAPVNEVTYNWSTLVHDPQVTDLDGDSLRFELVEPLGLGLLPIPGYVLPEVATGPGDFTWVDPATGVFLWDQPNMMGNFQIAIQCTERRLINGTWTVIGQVTRDMPLCVYQLPTGVADASPVETPLLTSLGSYGFYRIDTRFTNVLVLDAAGRTVLQLGRVPNGTIDLSRLTSGTYTVVAHETSGAMRSARVALVR